MEDEGPLIYYERPVVRGARMVLGFSGWMDGGEASTGTLEYLVEKLEAHEFAEIDPEGFYIYGFPGSMETSAMFRPRVEIEDGAIKSLEEPGNAFYYSEAHNLILFAGKEPNLCWNDFAECFFDVVEDCEVSLILFAGTVAGIVPHTRAPRFFGTVSSDTHKHLLQQHGIRPSNYAGPASFLTYLTTLCGEREVPMMSLVAEIPAYVQGRNAKCIEAVAQKIASVLDLSVDLSDLGGTSEEFTRRLSKVVEDRTELAELIHKMEEDYDKEVSDARMAELRSWFEKQDIWID